MNRIRPSFGIWMNEFEWVVGETEARRHEPNISRF
jgi:hypothetical protein